MGIQKLHHSIVFNFFSPLLLVLLGGLKFLRMVNLQIASLMINAISVSATIVEVVQVNAGLIFTYANEQSALWFSVEELQIVFHRILLSCVSAQDINHISDTFL